MRTETAMVVTSDGLSLAADLLLPDGEVRGAAVVCHPHPLHGGDRSNPVVTAMASALASAGFATIRFDFRGAGGSPGRHDDGRAERLDVQAALDAAVTAASGPVVLLAGYSFGAVMALSVDDPRISGWLAVAPPLRPGGSLLGPDPLPAASDPRPKHLLVATHDQFAPPTVVHAATAGWPATTVVEVPMADHFLAGAHRTLAAEATAFATTLLPPP